MDMRYFLTYLRLELKKGMKLIPFFLLSILITALTVSVAAVIFCTAMGKQHVLPKAEIALVAGSDGTDDSVEKAGVLDFKTMMMIGLVQNMDSVKSICHVSYMSPAEAARALENREISAAVYLPDGIYESINTGENTPVKVRLADGGEAGFLSGLFRELVNAGVTLIQTVERAIYPVDMLADEHPVSGDLGDIEDRIFSIYATSALARTSTWNSENVSGSSLSLEEFYLVCAVLMILLLFGTGFRKFYVKEEAETAVSLTRLGVPGFLVSAAKVISITAVLFVLLVIVTAGANVAVHFLMPERLPALTAASVLSAVMPGEVVFSIAAAFLMACYIHLIYTIVPEKNSGLLYLLITIMMFILCGGMLPSGWMPGPVRAAAKAAPVRVWQGLIEGVMGANAAAGAAPGTIIAAILYGVGMLLPAGLVRGIREWLPDRQDTHLIEKKASAAAVSGRFSPTGSSAGGDRESGDSLRISEGSGAGRSAGRVASHGVCGGVGSNFYRFCILIKANLRSPSVWTITAAGVLLLLVISSATLPSARNNRIGIVSGEGKLSSAVASELLLSDGSYEYVAFSNKDELREAVAAETVDCGFVLDERIDRAVYENEWNQVSDSMVSVPNLKGCVDYLFATSTTKGEAAKESVFTCLFDHMSEEIMMRAIDSGGIFQAPSEELKAEVRALMERLREGGETFDVVFEYAGAGAVASTVESDRAAAEAGADKAEADSSAVGNRESRDSAPGSRSVWALVSVLIFAAALFFAQRRFNPETTAVISYLRGAGFGFAFLETLAPLLVFGAVMVLAGAVSGAAAPGAISAGVRHGLLLGPFCIVCALWATGFARLFRNQTVCLFVAVAVILLAAVVSPGLVGSELTSPVVRGLRYVLPGAW